MKRMMKRLLPVLMAIAPLTICAQKVYELKDISGKVQVNVIVNDKNVEYSVLHDNDVMVAPSPIFMKLTDGTAFGLNPKVKKISRRSVNETIYPPIYKKKSIKDQFNELTIDFKGGYSLVFRAYEDGAAYRFVSELKKPFMVESEQASFCFPNDPKVFVASPKGRMNEGKKDPFYSSFQNTYLETALSAWDKEQIAFLPVLVEGKNGKKICITEADLMNYPGMYVKHGEHGYSLDGIFAAYPKTIVDEVRGLKGVVKSREPYIARVEGNTAFPWRVMVIAKDDAELLCNDMVYKLATPAQFTDFSWIKPGKVAWDWWNDWNLYNVDFRAGINNETYKYYIDFASESTGKYGVVFLLHGWGGNQSSWGPSGLNIQSIADAQTSNGSIRPLIYIMPEGFNSYFCNRYDGKFNYMDMFINELVPLIDKRFRTTASKTERAVAGFSMGGFGALSIASQHPETFSVSIGLSPSLNTDEQYISLSQDGWNLQWGNNFGGSGQTGTGRLTSYYKSQCPLHFFKDKPSSTFQTVRYYIDCGDDEERLYAGNGELHSLLRDKNIKHEYRVRNGAHTDSYWRESMKEALPFIERSFKGENYPQETLKKFTEELHATNKNIKVGNSNIELWLPDDYNSELTYKVLYYSKGEGNVNLTTEKVAVALDSLMQIKRMIIAGFDVKEVIQNEISFSTITDAIEKTIHTESNADFRLGLAYGSEADYLYKQSSGNTPAINFFFAEDAGINNLSDENLAKIYYLDITDGGSNYNSMLTLFNGLRDAEVPVQYRVRNGLDSEQSAQTGIYSMSYYIGEQLIKK